MSFSQVTDVEIVAVASGVPTSTNNRSSVAGSGTHGTADGHFLVTWRAGLTDDNPSNYDPYSFSYALFDPVTGSTVASGLLGEAIIGPSEETLVGAPLFLGQDLIAFESSTYPYDYFSYHVEIRNPTGAPHVLPDTLVNFMPLFVLADGTLVATGTGPFQYVAVYNPVTRSVAAEYNLGDPFLFVTSVSGVDIGDDRSVLLFETASLSNDVWAAYYDPAASSGSNPFRLNTLEWNSSGPQAWSLGGNDVLFAWNDGGSDGSGGTVRGRVVDPDGPGGSADVVLTTTTAGNQTLAGGEVLADGRVLVVWQDELSDGAGNALRGRIVDPTDIDGSVDFRINTSVAGNQTLLDLTLLDDGRILATWADTDNGATGANIRARIINPANPANTFDFQINTTLPGNQTLAATTALADGRQFYLWNSTAGDGSGSAVYGRFLDPSNPGGSTDFVVNTTTLGHQNGAELHVMDDGSLLVIWLDHSTGHASYRMRLIDPTDPSASSEQVLAASPGAQSNLHVEILGDGRIGFSWDELQAQPPACAASSGRSTLPTRASSGWAAMATILSSARPSPTRYAAVPAAIR